MEIRVFLPFTAGKSIPSLFLLPKKKNFSQKDIIVIIFAAAISSCVGIGFIGVVT